MFKPNLNDFIEDINYGVTNCKIILVEPNESNDYAATYMREYRKIRKDLSNNYKNVFYYSIPKNIGVYSFFVDNQMMLDNVHPNKKGNEIIGRSLYEFLKNIK